MSHRGTVHFVDDDEALRRATARLLGACGFEVRTYASAEEFRAGFDPSQQGCLLLDVMMPGLSGLELHRELLRAGDAPPVVFLSGHADAPTRSQALRNGARAFLQKPVCEEDLVAALDAALGRSGPLRRESAAG